MSPPTAPWKPTVAPETAATRCNTSASPTAGIGAPIPATIPGLRPCPHRLTLQSDYYRSFADGKAKFDAGIKTICNGNHSLQRFPGRGRPGVYVDTNASYNYSYADNTYAAYGSFTQHLGDRFSYMAGLRFEQYQYRVTCLTAPAAASAITRPGFTPACS